MASTLTLQVPFQGRWGNIAYAIPRYRSGIMDLVRLYAATQGFRGGQIDGISSRIGVHGQGITMAHGMLADGGSRRVVDDVGRFCVWLAVGKHRRQFQHAAGIFQLCQSCVEG
jgi:hypothetical protein